MDRQHLLEQLEHIAKRVMEANDDEILGMCFALITEDSVETSYSANVHQMLMVAGVIQQDAMVETLSVNGMISMDGVEEDDNGIDG